MTVYAIAMFSIRDPAAYERYQAWFVGVKNRYKGQLLAADKHPVVVEGSWDLEKVVLLSFPKDADSSGSDERVSTKAESPLPRCAPPIAP